jgi:hypothetical protein
MLLVTSESRNAAQVLADAQIQQFTREGFVKIDQAFPRELADQGRAILWRDFVS